MGAPFLPVRGMLGSAYLEVNPRLKVIVDPFSGEELAAVQALRPDAALVHGSKGDHRGNLLIPRRADWHLAIRAARQVIATVEEKVTGPLQDSPDWRLIPSIYVTALALCPGGAAPSGFPGYYDLDAEELRRYLQSSKDPATFREYLEKNI
jgi:glutaconate CoA-transferase subunit A